MQTWVRETFDILFLKCVPKIFQGEVFALVSRWYIDVKNTFLYQNKWHSRAVFTQRITTQAPPVLLYLMARCKRAGLKFCLVLCVPTWFPSLSLCGGLFCDPRCLILPSEVHSIHLGVHLPNCLWKETGWIPEIRKISLWLAFGCCSVAKLCLTLSMSMLLINVCMSITLWSTAQ